MNHARKKKVMQKRFLWAVFFLLLTLLYQGSLKATPKPAYNWRLLHSHVVYAKYLFRPSPNVFTTIHAFKIDPTKVCLDVVVADKQNPRGQTVRSLAEKNKAQLVINGGFFTREHKSIGLLMSKGEVLNPLHKTSWWSIFGIKDEKPFIEKPKGFTPSEKIKLAVQAGPRLVIDGSIPKLKAGIAARSAIGITQDNKIVLVVTEGDPISMRELALRMKNSRYKGGLECIKAMALDGGGSSQIYAKIGEFELSIPGRSPIPNGIAVYLK